MENLMKRESEEKNKAVSEICILLADMILDLEGALILEPDLDQKKVILEQLLKYNTAVNVMYNVRRWILREDTKK